MNRRLGKLLCRMGRHWHWSVEGYLYLNGKMTHTDTATTNCLRPGCGAKPQESKESKP